MVKVTLAAAFALGLLYGRKVKAVEVLLPPKVVYLPLSRAGSLAEDQLPPELEEKLRSLGLPPETVDKLTMKAEELYNIMREREACVQILYAASKALNERKISPATYRSITRRWTAKLVQLEGDLEKKEEELRREVQRIAREASARTAASRGAVGSVPSTL